MAAYFHYAPDTTSDAAPPPPAPPAVTVSAPLHQEIIEWDEFTGQFAAVDYVELRARVSGYLTEIHFEDGQIVEKGAPLFEIDPRPYEAVLASARAQLARASAQVDLAKRQEERTAELLEKDFESRSRHDERLAELKVATASLGEADPKTRTRKALYEPVHGSAPDIAGKGIANPIAMIASFGMALRYSFNLGRQADWIDQAISAALAKGLRTADIKSDGSKVVSTTEMGSAILAELEHLAG